jgi:recombination associated protein RdgC
MFKSATVFEIQKPADFKGLAEKLAACPFTPVGSLQAESFGFEPVHEGTLTFRSHNCELFRFTVEQKRIPKSAINVELKARCAAFEKEAGVPPGKKAKKELRERVVDDLLPRALPSRRSVLVWADYDSSRLVIDSTSNTTIDLFWKAFFKCVQTDIGTTDKWLGARVLGEWLDDLVNLPSTYSVDDAVKLEYPNGAVVTFKKADLDTERVRGHLSNGASVASLAMTYDSRLSFVVTPARQIRSIKPLDVLKERQVENDLDAFENDFVLMTGELRALFDSFAEWA